MMGGKDLWNQVFLLVVKTLSAVFQPLLLLQKHMEMKSFISHPKIRTGSFLARAQNPSAEGESSETVIYSSAVGWQMGWHRRENQQTCSICFKGRRIIEHNSECGITSVRAVLSFGLTSFVWVRLQFSSVLHTGKSIANLKRNIFPPYCQTLMLMS